ncbi:hypothetical protein CKAH01_10699 [Colletotrichum kahawae]|uniref:Uncharacterized protein n=1 Tax=Colletotrichum kahawae TaxID=34407 RepID=A0AAD9XVH5_COLKA|nr:hypothetical protein CKAH01_10699 [Colletotrichum kahawae]
MYSELHSVFSPLRFTPLSETPSAQNFPQDHGPTFLLCDSDEEGDSTKRERVPKRGRPHKETSSPPSTASPDVATKITTACFAATQHHEPTKKSEPAPSPRVIHIFVEASIDRSLYLRTASSNSEIITQSFDWNTSGPNTYSTGCGIPRPDSPTI